jgi:hypothetical protein
MHAAPPPWAAAAQAAHPQGEQPAPGDAAGRPTQHGEPARPPAGMAAHFPPGAPVPPAPMAASPVAPGTAGMHQGMQPMPQAPQAEAAAGPVGAACQPRAPGGQLIRKAPPEPWPQEPQWPGPQLQSPPAFKAPPPQVMQQQARGAAWPPPPGGMQEQPQQELELPRSDQPFWSGRFRKPGYHFCLSGINPQASAADVSWPDKSHLFCQFRIRHAYLARVGFG